MLHQNSGFRAEWLKLVVMRSLEMSPDHQINVLERSSTIAYKTWKTCREVVSRASSKISWQDLSIRSFLLRHLDLISMFRVSAGILIILGIQSHNKMGRHSEISWLEPRPFCKKLKNQSPKNTSRTNM